ncbi:MAG: efflux transporter periplasmic adaptor subunit [Stappia sp.]|uniref:efflux RND transporter periplasmic adaptor subunit n=1 Tax=Stappia sp. TaxID=1870903 RepID=UPI000C565002|nr:efflux RND transporter periplasmic adaptor subunit [Stappia sp.]MAB01032.1 efflux transporter periplasmic adaptor subunit [Stappia sp.]MBM19888.1 efflux transporter periplasmic adaptor subunit [Stappia sp.]
MSFIRALLDSATQYARHRAVFHPFEKPARVAFAALVGISSLFPVAAIAQGYPPSSVGVVVVEPQAVAITSELPGRISATRVAEVRPRVGGIIETRVFEQGSLVSEGDVLFRLDRATYEVALEAARAAVARAEAVLTDSRQIEQRTVSLSQRKVASQAALDSAVAARLQAEASLAEARARLRAAEVNLGYTEIKAPISGRTGRALTTEGALVSAQGEILTTIQQLDTVYADMQQPVSELLRLRRALAAGDLKEIEPGTAEVELYVDDGTLYPHPGRLLFAEVTVERSSGQVTLRAEFPNPDGTLLPGMYVRVSVEQARREDAILVPAQSVRRDASGTAQVFVVGDGSAVEVRPVTLGRSVGNHVIVESGLQADDLVIVDGFQKIGPGAPVAPVCWTDPAAGEDATSSDACTRRLGQLASVAAK